MRNGLIIIAIVLLSACKKDKSEPVAIDHSAHQVMLMGGYADSVNAGIIPKDTLKGSPVRTTMTNVGSNHVHIKYGSPGVRNRVIWGGLVAYDEVWATGAHRATSIQFMTDVTINTISIPAGKYGLFTIPGRETWKVILNRNWDQHMADDYDQNLDVIRVEVKPEVLEQTTQRLTYSVEEVSNSQGVVLIEWERIRLRFEFANNN
ncbi:MAG: DUF2911 domain-containing protein [Cytophagales bacterium]|nr:DUF2911 domain-containing protein [Cytophagales bacterium]